MEDKVIIVTGGSGLLGKAIIADLTKRGATVINADINVSKNLETGSYYCDVTSFESIKDTVESVYNHFQRIDGLVNNAYPRTKDWGTTFENISPESLGTNISWQLNSYILFCQEVLKYMKMNKSGSIVNMTSIYGVVGNDFTVYEGTDLNPPAAYPAIKGGLISITRYLASKYGEFGLRVNCLSPGGIFDNQPRAFVNAYEKKVPMKRMGRPEDIAPAVSFLLMDDSQYITGQNLIVDGGWTSI